MPFWDIERGPRGQQFLRVIGRMRPGVTLAAARDEVAGIARHISRAYPEYGAVGRVFNTVALKADEVRDIRGPLLALFAGVAILLMIACVNVASLLIARAASRTRETSLRLALGATRGRLLRQSLAEGLILTLLGAAAGLIVGHVGLQRAARAAPRLARAAGRGADRCHRVRVHAGRVGAVGTAVLARAADRIVASGSGPSRCSRRRGRWRRRYGIACARRWSSCRSR